MALPVNDGSNRSIFAMSDVIDTPLVIPAGTQVVLQEAQNAVPAGTVGVVVAVPARMDGLYQVRLPDGHELALPRSVLRVRTIHQREQSLPPMPAQEQLRSFIIYRCIVGSRAFGLDDEHSDTDRRGIYLPPARLHWSLAGLPEQLEDHDAQACYWELEKFLRMALKSNPNVLECLYTPLVEHATPLAEELRAMRACFLSRQIYQTYNGYVLSQFRKMEQDVRTHGQPRFKHAMHLIRLLLSGIRALREQTIPVQVTEHREQLLAIKRGEMDWEALHAWRLELHRTFETAYAETDLPEQADYPAAEAFLLRARRSMVED